ncbi:MAG TPA: MFS transporter [Gemmatimonadales bacterium]|jgi:EmrB/QacA subfamily drug resistance transporter
MSANHRKAEPWVLAASILGSSMAFVDGSVVNLALPALQATLGATVTDVQWVVEGYSLFLSTLLLMGGALGDRLGRRLVFVLGTALFAIASLACGVAPSVNFLIGARAVQGVGAAMLVPGSLALISATFPEDRRGRAIGTWSAWSAAAAGIGPVAGGWLIEAASWRWVFLINLPLAAVTIAISLARVPESRTPGERDPLDWTGAALVTAGLGALVYGLIGATHLRPDWTSVAVAIGASVLLLIGFVWREKTAASPMLPLSIFRSRDFSAANALTLFLYSAMGGGMFFLPFVMIQVHHYSAAATGASFLPFIVLMFVLSPWSGGLVSRYGARPMLVIGPLVAAAGYALMAVPGTSGPYWTTFFPGIVVLGIGMGIAVAPLTTTVMGAVSSKHSGLASGINNAVSRTAGLLAVAVFGLVAASRFDRALDERLDAARVPAEVRKVLDTERSKLAGAKIPKDVPEGDRRKMRGAIDGAFVETFRLVALLTAGMAAVSAIAGGMVGKDGKDGA